ncbi:MAG: EAL domain-containing protein [Gallionellaceae bacterium]|jgi:diguanylate cyclase (GGDEF)-like protein/PAS domain S-box-containing protein
MIAATHCRVLLVEDDPSDANLTKLALRASHTPLFELEWVTSLEDAVYTLSLNRFDVLLLDLSLPDSHGLPTVTAIRNQAPNLPVIVLTGNDDSSFALETLEAGAQDYLVKGKFDTDALVRTIGYSVERKHLSDNLQQSHDLLQKLSSQIPGLIFQLRRYPDGRMSFPYASQAMFDMYGVTPEEAREDASQIFAFQHPDDAARITASIEKSATNLSEWHEEYRIILPERGECWREGVAKPEHLDDGSVLWHGFITDVTERKAGEERQRLAERVFETTGEAILVTDLNGTIVAVNPAFTQITGYSEAEALGNNPRLLKSGRHDLPFYRDFWNALGRKGMWVGEVWNKRKNGEIYTQWESISSIKDAAGNTTRYVAIFSDISEIKRAQDRVEELAWRDPLTGLANRALFLRQVEQTLQSTRRDSRFAAVLLLDLDRFKEINEARGLAMGDMLLRAVSERFTQILHADDLLARLDSDEFGILLHRIRGTREAAGREALAIAEKLRAVLNNAIEINDELIHIDASIGITLLPDLPHATAIEVLRQADMAMDKAKKGGRARTMFFEAAMGETVKERFQLEAELRNAIADNQLRLFFQPQVNAQGVQVGAEALVRWQHPTRGLIPPNLFIPLAETSDLIVALDRWMLLEVCKVLAQLDAEGRALRLSVNISPRHFQQPDFVEVIRSKLSLSGADPCHLVLELTEGIVIGDIGDVVAKMTTLSALGIHFSIDDFGTGYSSLAYIKRLPIHELKIDKSFIQDCTSDPNDAALVETIISIAQHLHFQIVAEGVETQEQADFLNSHGQVVHQGYLYGRPEPVENWLARLHEAP